MTHHRKKTAERTQFLSVFINFLINPYNYSTNLDGKPRLFGHRLPAPAPMRQRRGKAATKRQARLSLTTRPAANSGINFQKTKTRP
ncbi:hypothetical protein OL67_000184 [Phaeobacter piscinae]|nr:hypothetical protein OL67_000184 [Phaeobacter piscinae]